MTNRFEDGFWYIDHLGFLAQSGVQVFARSTLCGGDYELINRTTGLPNPDYFIALLWKRTTGKVSHPFSSFYSNIFFLFKKKKKVALLATSDSTNVKAYSMCTSTNDGSVTVIVLNFELQANTINFLFDSRPATGSRKSFYLRSAGSLTSDTSEIFTGSKWIPLRLTPDGHLPDIQPVVETASSPATMQPHSFAFFVFPQTILPACHLESKE